VCGGEATEGIPVYEDLVLPDDWEGEWFGADACAACARLQHQLTEPIPVSLLLQKYNPKLPVFNNRVPLRF